MTGTHEFIEDKRNEDILININGELFPRNEAKISVFDSAFLVGDGIWESFRLHNGKLTFINQHMARLKANAKTLDYRVAITPEAIIAEVYKTIRANQMTSDDVHIRVMVTRGTKKSPTQDPRASKSGPTIVIIAEYKAPSISDEVGLSLFTVHVRRGGPDVQDPKLHTHSKLNCILACIQATKAGADEALMLDPLGFVSTCNSTNFFIIRDNQVWTSTGQYCVNGITRGCIISICKRNAIEIFERNFSLYEVYGADEAFVTGTFAGIRYVREVDGRVIGDGKPGSMTRRLRTLYAELLNEECPLEI